MNPLRDATSPLRTLSLDNNMESSQPLIMDSQMIAYLMERMCLRKSNLQEEQANRIIDEELTRGRVLYYYKCPLCSSHHITSQPPGEIFLRFDYK